MRSYYHYHIMIIFRVFRRRPSVLDKMLFHDNISSRWSIIHSECLAQRSFTEWKLVLVLAIAIIPVSTQQTLRCKTTCFCVLCLVNCCSSDFDEAFGTTEILQKIPLWKHVVLLCESYRLWQKSSQKRDIRIVPFSFFILGPSWLWSYGSWIYNYLCNQCLSPLMLGVRISIRAMCTTLCDKVCLWLVTGRWFSPGSTVFSTNKTDHHDITEILLKVA